MKKLLLSLMVLLSMACAKNDDNNNASNPSTPPPNSGQGTNPAPPGELLGTWNKACNSLGGQGGFARNSITVETTTATMLTQVFQTNAACSGTADLETRAVLAYTVPSFTANQINQINMTVNSIRARFNTNEGVIIANTSGFCDFHDWQVGVEKEVAGRKCVQDLPAAGQPYYDIFQIQNSQLFIGQVDQAHSGKTPETRPTQLESTPYTR